MNKLHLLILCAGLGFYSGSLAAQIYKYVDRNGLVKYTDRPPHDAYVRLKKTWKGWVEPTTPRNYRHNKRRFRTLVVDTASRYEVSPTLVKAVIHAESYYNPSAISHAGAVGLMQLMPATAQRYGVGNRQNPRQNIEGGVRYLRDLIEMFDNDVTLALAAYNAGENAVKRYGNKVPPYPETENYVKKVMILYDKYRGGKL